MKKIVLIGLLPVLLMPVTAMAQSDFDGTWKIDLAKSVMPTKPDVLLLQNGAYQCKSCVPIVSISVPAARRIYGLDYHAAAPFRRGKVKIPQDSTSPLARICVSMKLA